MPYSDSPPPTAQSWAPPKHPLPPHRLARLANALGVSTPMPAIHTPSPMLSPSYNASSSALDTFRRSPTPSTASTFAFSPATSKYLLHVIPPIHLPHDTDAFDSELTPPPSTASGYHTQFRRGTLVPVHSTLQAQLAAIAKEYALPSTAGLILYLVSQPTSASARSPPPSDKSFSFNDELDEPGPRLSEDIWRHLWTRVVKTELRDEGVPLTLAPPLLGLGLGLAANRSTPYLNHPYPLPLLSTGAPVAALHPGASYPSPYPFTPSPTTPSSTSDLYAPSGARFGAKSAPPSASAASSSRSRSDDTHETPATSQAASERDRADSLDLPGLHSDALIPILAKVEFDVDRRRAGWYEPWLRSRRANHRKRERALGERERERARKNSGNGTTAESSSSPEEEESAEKKAPLAFRLGKKGALGGSSLRSKDGRGDKRYLPLSESPMSMTGSDSDSGYDDFVARHGGRGRNGGKDPLADVFGEDADVWADLHAEASARGHGREHPKNPHVVQLALTAAELDADARNSDYDEEDDDDTRRYGAVEDGEEEQEQDVREVLELMGGHGRPALGVEIPGMSTSPSRRRAPPAPLVLHTSPSSGGSKDAPPPPASPTHSHSDSSSHSDEEDEVEQDEGGEARGGQTPPDRLAYLDGDGDGDGEDPEHDPFDGRELLSVPRKSMYDPGKRKGDVYEEMDLGLSGEEDDIDMDDPNDRRKSQVIMRAQLDEIEKNLAQFSPRMLRTELEEQQIMSIGTAASSPSLSPPGSAQFPPLSHMQTMNMPRSNADVFPPTPRLPTHPHVEEEESDSEDLSQQAAWPAVPYTSLPDRPIHSPPGGAGAQHLPPQLAVNGVSAAMPKRFRAGSHRSHTSTASASSESELRKRDLAIESAAPAGYPAMTPSIGPKSSLNSPLIPLSPDPFGRHPSSVAAPESSGGGGMGMGGGRGMEKRTSGAYWEPPVVIPAPVPPPANAEVQRKSSASSLTTGTGSSSRFSTDSINGVGKNAADAAQAQQKQTNRTTLMSVKGIKKLWRKSNKNSVSGISTQVRSPMEAVHENAYSPLSPPAPPQRPNRPSMEDMDLPDVVDVPPLPRTPITGAFPGRGTAPGSMPTARPSPNPSPRPSLSERRPSVGQERRPSVGGERRPSMSGERRPSQDQLSVPSRRPSQDQVPQVPPSPSPHMQQFGAAARRPSDAQSVLSQMSTHSQMSMNVNMGMHPQLSVPPPMLRSANNAPIIAAKAGPPRATLMDGLAWDQESPYPTRVATPARAPSVSSSASRPPSRPPSASSMHPASTSASASMHSHSASASVASMHHPAVAPTPPPQNPTPPPPMPSQESTAKDHRNSVRKSILKWKSQTNGNGNGNGAAVPAPLTPSATSFRTRKTSLTGSPSQGSPLNLPLEIPPSPKIPDQFITSYVGSHPPPPAPTSRPNSAAIVRRRLSAKMASTSTDGTSTDGTSSSKRQSSSHHRPRESMASSSHSHGSEDTRDTHESTSLDTSGFEIVSPRMGGTLSFPYTEMDHDRPPLVDGVRSM
ncbi:hypothetical protein B0H19DRAFT_1276922 [Mycena capillaripes]|nr:hypothetical protein B0H19DRAFT_1276922 [Mycena capillaripes]